MRISVLTEIAPREQRVALAPDSVVRLVKLGLEVAVQKNAGLTAGVRDEAYTAAGAKIMDDPRSTVAGATVVAKVQPPTADEIALIPEGATVISLMRPGQSGDLARQLAARHITGLALELVPRITRAQSMDVLSSQATVAGYKAVLLRAEALPKFLPMLTTNRGRQHFAGEGLRHFGAGVAGLQAIATARRLGGVVSAFDVRAAVREQVQRPWRDVRRQRDRQRGGRDGGRLRARAELGRADPARSRRSARTSRTWIWSSPRRRSRESRRRD